VKVLITGATSGIGEQLALDYLRGGHDVFCCGRKISALSKLEKDHPDAAHLHSFDVGDLAECTESLQNIPQLDLVILNAGTCEYVNARKFDAELFARVIKTNLIGTANCLQILIPKIKEKGALALMGSSSSFLPLPRAEAYGASKAALDYLAQTLQISLGHINVSYIAPGFVETPLTDKNNFPMPMRVGVEFASKSIRKGLDRSKREIHFPQKFTFALKIIGLLPKSVQQFLIKKALAY
jgi:short-subunit dehydrogenase